MLYGEASQKQEATEGRREVRVISCEEFLAYSDDQIKHNQDQGRPTMLLSLVLDVLALSFSFGSLSVYPPCSSSTWLLSTPIGLCSGI